MRPSSIPVLALALAATTGCTYGLRGAAGGGTYGARADVAAGGGGAFGLIMGKSDAMLLGFDLDVGPRHLSWSVGHELDLTLGDHVHPLGLRLRYWAGETAFFDAPDGALLSFGLTPGFWWMPFDTAASPHRVVFGIEPRALLLVPVDGSSIPVTPAFLAVLTVDWMSVPCTMFGGPTCPEPVRRPAPAPEPRQGDGH